MTKYCELGALVEKTVCDKAYEKIYHLSGVEYVTVETGRSNDLFSECQFGEFGEAAILTVIVESKSKEKVFNEIYGLLGCGEADIGILFEEKNLESVKYFY